MSSTYSTNLRTELIGSGDQAGTWGTTTNTSLGSILEQAIAGVSGGPYVSGTYPAVNFPTDADLTLTANNGLEWTWVFGGVIALVIILVGFRVITRK